MWKRGGQSSALDRAQALLSAKRDRGGDPAVDTPRTHTFAVDQGNTKPAPPNVHTLFSDVSDLSSLSSAPEIRADAVHSVAPEKNRGPKGVSSEGLRPPSSLGGGGSRFLKKVPPPAANSSRSPVQKNQTLQMPEPKYAPSSQRGSQAAALSRLAQIESRFRSRNQAQERVRSGISLSPEAASTVPVQSSGDRSPEGRRFLKKNSAVAADGADTAGSEPDDGVLRTRSRAGAAPSSLRAAAGVSLESDEEDMKRLLGDSVDSPDNSWWRTAHKVSNRSIEKVVSTPPPPPADCPPSPFQPASPTHRSSPFRFTGPVQAQFSPSALSPPHVSPSPRRSLSSVSGHEEVLSLEELFPVGPDSEEPHSRMSEVSSEDGQQDFKMNVMSLDDLVPAAFGFTEETPKKERGAKRDAPPPGPWNTPQQAQRLREEDTKQQQEEVEEEEVLDYQSDFESESRREFSVSQVSEDLQGDAEEVEEASEVREEEEEASKPDACSERTEDDYSSDFSDAPSQTSDGTSGSFSRRRDSRSSASQGGRRRAATTDRKEFKEAAVQTQPATTAYARSHDTFEPPLGMTFMNPASVAAHALSAETVEALSNFNPAVFVLTEMLKQQLAMTRRFMESNRHLHCSLVRSLEPPNYRYTTLEDTKEYISKHRAPKLTMEEALEEAQREVRDHRWT